MPLPLRPSCSRCEIIGLLGGAFNAEQRVLEIREAYPCRRAEGQASGEPAWGCLWGRGLVGCGSACTSAIETAPAVGA